MQRVIGFILSILLTFLGKSAVYLANYMDRHPRTRWLFVIRPLVLILMDIMLITNKLKDSYTFQVIVYFIFCLIIIICINNNIYLITIGNHRLFNQ